MIRAVILVCAQALFIQSIAAQCYGAYPAAIAAAPCAGPYGAYAEGPWAYPAAALAASNGPGLAVTSASPVPPTGVSVASENAIEGALAVAGAVPFLGTVGLEGALPTAGAGAVSYGCGNGEVAIVAEDIAAAPLALEYAGPYGFGAGPYGYGAGPYGYSAFGAPYGACGCGI